MRIAILGDARYPVALNWAGHGLGRSIARLGKALAQRGHDVVIFGKSGSWVDDCEVTEDKGEGEDLARYMLDHWDKTCPIIDSTHVHALMDIAPDWPIIAKVVDLEHEAPFNRVYNTRRHAIEHGDPDGLVISEAVDVDAVPFNPNARQPFLVWAALKVDWKRADWAQAVAHWWRYPILMIGDGDIKWTEETIDLPAVPPILLYEILGRCAALVSAVPSAGMLEAAAAGTPSLCMVTDDSIAHGITGWVIGEDLSGMPRDLCMLDRQAMRDWVAAERSTEKLAEQWEGVIERVMKGERW